MNLLKGLFIIFKSGLRAHALQYISTSLKNIIITSVIMSILFLSLLFGIGIWYAILAWGILTFLLLLINDNEPVNTYNSGIVLVCSILISAIILSSTKSDYEYIHTIKLKTSNFKEGKIILNISNKSNITISPLKCVSGSDMLVYFKTKKVIGINCDICESYVGTCDKNKFAPQVPIDISRYIKK